MINVESESCQCLHKDLSTSIIICFCIDCPTFSLSLSKYFVYFPFLISLFIIYPIFSLCVEYFFFSVCLTASLLSQLLLFFLSLLMHTFNSKYRIPINIAKLPKLRAVVTIILVLFQNGCRLLLFVFHRVRTQFPLSFPFLLFRAINNEK